MNLKTFTAGSMAAALTLVKRELGPSAVILHTRTYKRGGVLGFGARTVVEITAADDSHVTPHRPRPRRAAAGAPAASVEARMAAAPPGTAGDLIRRTYAAAKAELRQTAPSVPAGTTGTMPQAGVALGAPVTAPPGLTPVIAPPHGGQEQLAEEMRAVRRMVAQMMRQQRQRELAASGGSSGRGGVLAGGGGGGASGDGGDLPDQLFDQYLTLLKQEVTEELAEEVVQQVRGALTPAELGHVGTVRRAVQDAVAKLIPFDDSCGRLEPVSDGRPRTIALIGPTGVGKTTTIAKLAANFKLRQKKNVGLITLDTYRIAAVDQLRTYANIIGVPLHVVTTADELVVALRQCASCHVVLIDTAGRSQRDDPKLQQLAGFLQAANPHEVHLVLSSTCTQSVLLDTVERFSRLRTDRIIFTKLDEAVSFGVLLNVARKVNKRLSFVTTGQEVPHHIEPGRPERLAALVMGDRL